MDRQIERSLAGIETKRDLALILIKIDSGQTRFEVAEKGFKILEDRIHEATENGKQTGDGGAFFEGIACCSDSTDLIMDVIYLSLLGTQMNDNIRNFIAFFLFLIGFFSIFIVNYILSSKYKRAICLYDRHFSENECNEFYRICCTLFSSHFFFLRHVHRDKSVPMILLFKLWIEDILQIIALLISSIGLELYVLTSIFAFVKMICCFKYMTSFYNLFVGDEEKNLFKFSFTSSIILLLLVLYLYISYFVELIMNNI
mmetsp:Transcript_53990/g.69330  ORF Transcript_53990/g.69330 Transcript_53990/m.69330 type:complete len:257 (+) Transcript_53990:114-884(+)